MLDAELRLKEDRSIGFIDTDCLKELNRVLDAADLMGVYAEMQKLVAHVRSGAVRGRETGVGMSNTIQARDYSAKQASLLQLAPSALINDFENRTLKPRDSACTCLRRR